MKVGRVEMSIVVLSGILSVAFNVWAILLLYPVMLWIIFNNHHPFDFKSAKTIDLAIRRKDGAYIFLGLLVVLMATAFCLHMIYTTNIYATVFDPTDLQAFSILGLYNQGAEAYQALYDAGHQRVAVFSKFSEFVMTATSIVVVCLFFPSFSRIAVFLSNFVVVGKKSIFLNIFAFTGLLILPLFGYLLMVSDIRINVFIESGNIRPSHHYSRAFAFWFAVVAGFIVPVAALGRVVHFIFKNPGRRNSVK